MTSCIFFISKRNSENLKNTIYYIGKNYSKIQMEISKNILTTKKQFQKKFIEILND